MPPRVSSKFSSDIAMEVVEKNDRVVDDDCSADCVEKARARLPSSRMAEAAFMVASVKVKSKRSSQEPKSNTDV